MRRIILAALTSSFLVSGTYNVLAECQTMAQARAANPNTYLSYHVIDGAHCWFPNEPRRRDIPVAEKRKVHAVRASSEERSKVRASNEEQSTIRTSNADSDSARVAQAPIDFHDTYEVSTTALLPDQSPYVGRIEGTFSAMGLGAHSVEIVESIILGRDAPNVEAHPIQPVDLPRQRGPPAASEAGYFKLAAWLLLTIGVGSIMAGVLDGYGDRFQAQLRRRVESWLYGQRLRLRDYPSPRTPLVKYIAYLEPTTVSVDRPSQSVRPQDELTSLSSLLRRIG